MAPSPGRRRRGQLFRVWCVGACRCAARRRVDLWRPDLRRSASGGGGRLRGPHSRAEGARLRGTMRQGGGRRALPAAGSTACCERRRRSAPRQGGGRRAADAVWWRPGSTEGWEVLFFFVFVLTASVGFEPRPMVVGARGAGEGGARCVALKPDDPKRRSIRRLDRSRRCQWRCLPGYKFVGTQCSDCLCMVQISGWT